MARVNCASCEELKKDAPSAVVNGLGTTEIASLKNNTGLNPSAGNDDCTDLNNLNDCLIGNMEEEVKLYDVCDWQAFMSEFVSNIYNVLKAMIASICGLWTTIKNISDLTNRVDCILDYIAQGAAFNFNEYTDAGESYLVAGKGVSFANVSSSGTAADVYLAYVAGGIAHLTGSTLFYTENFEDAKAVSNFDNNGEEPTVSSHRKGNPKWGNSGIIQNGGELLYEIRLKRSQFPQINRFFNGHIGQSAGFPLTGEIRSFGAGQYAYGQSGYCDTKTGEPQGTGSDRGHLVPDGWIYLQVRIKSADGVLGTPMGRQASPYGLIPMRINQDAIEC